MHVKPNQMVAALTPVVFAPLAGVVSVFAAKHAGVDIDASSLQAVFIAGATIAFAKAGLWLKGWQEYEKRLPLEDGGANGPAAETADGSPGNVDAPDIGPASDDPDHFDLDEFLDDDLADDDQPAVTGAGA